MLLLHLSRENVCVAAHTFQTFSKIRVWHSLDPIRLSIYDLWMTLRSFIASQALSHNVKILVDSSALNILLKPFPSSYPIRIVCIVMANKWFCVCVLLWLCMRMNLRGFFLATRVYSGILFILWLFFIWLLITVLKRNFHSKTRFQMASHNACKCLKLACAEHEDS